MSRSKNRSVKSRRRNGAVRREKPVAPTVARWKSGWVLLAIVAVIAVAAVSSLLLWKEAGSAAEDFPSGLAPGAAAGYNVLVITLDTTRADHLGCYGHSGAETPVLDGLAESGLRFADAVTVAPVTLPSHVSIFTGLYPPNHGVRRNGEYTLRPDEVTLAELFDDHGYDTAAFVGAFVLDRRFGLDQGFDHYDDAVNPATNLSVGSSYDERSAAQVTESAVGWLAARSSDRPFFAWVHYFDPHQPFDAPEPWAGRFVKREYDGEIAYVDSQIGRLVGALEELGDLGNTVVAITADHGEGLGEHGESSHDFFIYESVMRVPMVVSAPGLFEGPVVVEDALVAVTDLFPTLLDLVGIPAPASDGLSWVRGLPGPERRVYMESLAPYFDYGWAPLYGLRRHVDKFIDAPREEYYDLRQDPGELRSLVPDPTLRDDLSSRLAEWPAVEEVVADAETIDPETRKRLEALGYVGRTGGPRDTRLDPKDMIEMFNRYDRARALARGGDVRGALAELQAVVAQSPGNRAALGEMARLYAMTGRLPEAERVLRESIALGATPDALTLLAQVLIATQRLEEAEQLADQALSIDARHGMAFIVLGDLASSGGRYGEAKELYEHAREVDPYRMGPASEQRLTALRHRLP